MPRPRASTLTWINAMLSSTVLFYAIGIENRLTKLETELRLLTNGATLTLPQSANRGQAGNASVQGR